VAAVWEVWSLAALGLLQFGVAYWWWTGPYLEKTRGWISALFALNGFGTARKAAEIAGLRSNLLDAVGLVGEKWTNLCLLAFVVIVLARERPRVRRWALTMATAAAVLLSPFTFWSLFTGADGGPAKDLMTLLLYTAMIAAGPALVTQTRRLGKQVEGVWLLALSVVGFRFAELVAWLMYLEVLNYDTAIQAASGYGKVASLGVLLGAFAWMLVVRTRESFEPGQRNFLDVSLLLLLTGFLFGFARNITTGDNAFAILFSLALLRPMGFLVVQQLLRDEPLADTDQYEQVKSGTTVFGASLVGIPVGDLFAFDTTGKVIVGLMFAGFALVAVRGWRIANRDPPPQTQTPVPDDGFDVDVEALPLDPDNVTLPDDWQNIASEHARTYADLNEAHREALADLARWQRIVLALYGTVDEGELPAYERTTPGLHFLTHTPYASIGSEIARTNDRYREILESHGLEAPTRTSDPDEPLIASQLGRAQGLDSPRVKSYRLSDLGETVAEAIVEDAGLASLDREQLPRFVGEGYPNAIDG
jgi:hypothetical protein